MSKTWILFLLLLIPLANAVEPSYNIIVEDNGNALVIVSLEGSGLISLPLQADVTEVKVNGALYKMKEDSVDVSIGSTGEAVVLYKTALLTKKQQGEWSFEIELLQNSMAAVAMPGDVAILDTEPEAFIEKLNYTKILFEDADNIKISYEFPDDRVIIEDGNTGNTLIYFIGAGLLVVILGIFMLRKPKKKSQKENILKTLSKNEGLVVKTLMENDGSMKRNDLERKTKLAKSSLANTLNILEKKKIIEIDKTYTTHFVRFTGWFNEL